LIGVSSPVFSVRPFEEVLNEITPHFDLWEILADADHFLPEIYEKVRNAIETSNMRFKIHAPFSDINIAAFDSRTREYATNTILETIRLTNELGIDVITFHPGYILAIEWYDKERVPKFTRESLVKIAKGSREYSVQVALENMPNMRFAICRTAREMEEMLNDLDIQICCDIGHANTNDQIFEMLKLKERFVNIHLHDNIGEKDKHMTLGKGNIDFKGILLKLKDYKGDYIIESRNLDSAIESKAVLQGLLEYQG
jgi:sugar phosphate isomerase/epimerase